MLSPTHTAHVARGTAGWKAALGHLISGHRGLHPVKVPYGRCHLAQVSAKVGPGH